MHIKFWLAYAMFLISDEEETATKYAAKMSEYAQNYRHCALLLAPLFLSKNLAKFQRPVFMKAIKFADQYEQALCLFCWTGDKDQQQMAFSKMVLLTPIGCTDGQFEELIEYYGINTKVREIETDALIRLRAIFSRRSEINPRMIDFLESLHVVDFERRNQLNLDMAH